MEHSKRCAGITWKPRDKIILGVAILLLVIYGYPNKWIECLLRWSERSNSTSRETMWSSQPQFDRMYHRETPVLNNSMLSPVWSYARCSWLRRLLQINRRIECIKVICSKWEEYEGVLDSLLTERPSVAYRAPISVPRNGPGRPRFDISKEQLEYLSSLLFEWNEIAVLLGVSRMTIYRYVYCESWLYLDIDLLHTQ